LTRRRLDMPPVVTFIGWHDSGKTTILCRVVKELAAKGYRIGVIKSSKHTGVSFDSPDTDTGRLARAGADPVAFVSPDRTVIMGGNRGLPFLTMAHRFFPDVDLVIGEGFKNAEDVDKIEVAGGKSSQDLRDLVSGVIAVVTDEAVPGFHVFRPDETGEIAEFLENRYILKGRQMASASLVVNGRKIPLKGFVQDCLAGTVAGFISSLKHTKGAREIEISVRIPPDGLPGEKK
jgi:molybdopterin-guanine dinucleotide biosynthesis protein B